MEIEGGDTMEEKKHKPFLDGTCDKCQHKDKQDKDWCWRFKEYFSRGRIVDCNSFKAE